jgi:glycosyltransferase involved in cell wall biosynthesis
LIGRPSVSILMPCINAEEDPKEAIDVALAQPECLEILIIIIKGGTFGSIYENLYAVSASNSRVRVIDSDSNGVADCLNKAFNLARGTFIGWLNSGQFYRTDALSRALAALAAHPEWLMVYGEVDFINTKNEIISSHPTKPPSVGIHEFQSGCFISTPSVIFRRSMGVMLKPIKNQLHEVFNFDYWLRAFAAFPNRIGYINCVQAYSRLHDAIITNSQRRQIAIETMQLLAKQFGAAPTHWLLTEAEELLDKSDQTIALDQLVEQCRPLVSAEHHAAAVEQINGMLMAHTREKRGDWGSLTFRTLIQLLRPELMQTFAAKANSDHALLSYVLRDGIREYPFIPYDAEIISDLQQFRKAPDCPIHLKRVPLQHASPLGSTNFLDRPFGVNLIGYAQGQLGIGEDLRCTATALDTVGVPTSILNFRPGQNIPQNDHSLSDRLTEKGLYAFNLFCLTTQEMARFLMERGPEQFHQRFNIGYCPWELQRWPGPWLPLFGLVDELWASSQHTLSAMQQGLAARNQAAPNPLPSTELLPLAVTLPLLAAQNRLQTRHAYGLPAEAVLFTFSFDLNSSIHRKNPLMALRAFQRAFPPDHPLADQVALLIKTHRPNRPNRDWDRLKREAAIDQRLHILENTLPRNELLELYAACDGFISLHRAEGFGRGLAEALMLGLDVIATDHGGNTDFCTGPLAHPVRCQMVRVNNGEYPYHRGQQWAQPSVAHAAELLQQVAERRCRDGLPDPSITAKYRQRFDPATCGARYRQQLEALWDKRQHLAPRLRFQDNGLTG